MNGLEQMIHDDNPLVVDVNVKRVLGSMKEEGEEEEGGRSSSQ